MADPSPEALAILDQFEAGQGQETTAEEILQQFELREGFMTPQAFNAKFAGQETVDIEPATPEINRLRAKLSFLGDNPEEQQAALDLIMPGAELLPVQQTGTTLFRRSKDEPFRNLDPGIVESFEAGIGEFRRQTAGDIGDVAGTGAQILGEMLGLIGRRPGGGRLVSDISRLALGAGGGEFSRQGLQTGLGTQRQSEREQAGLITGAATGSAIGGTIGAGVGGAVNVLRGRGIGRTRPEAVAAREAAQRIGTTELLPSQVSELPFLRLLERQSAALFPRIQRYLTNQEARTEGALKALVDPAARDRFIGETARAFNQNTDDMVNAAIDLLGVQARRTNRSGGRALQQGVQKWWQVSGTDVDNAYKAVRSRAEPEFNLAGRFADKDGKIQPSFLELAGNLRQGVLMRREGGQTFNVQQLDPQVRRFIEQAAQLDPSVAATNAPPFEQLTSLRRQIDDYALAGPAGPRINQTIANDLRLSIKRTLENPTNGDAEFVRQWKVANAMAEKRFTTREQIAVVDLARTQEPSQLVPTLARPGMVDNLVAIRKAVPAEQFGKFQESVAMDFLRDPFNITARLDEFDGPTLNVLMSKPRQQIMKETGVVFDRLGATKVASALESQTKVSGFFDALANTSDTARISAFKDLIARKGGAEGAFGKSARAALLDSIWRRSTRIEQNVNRVDFNRLQSTLSEFDKIGFLDILPKDTLRALRDVELVQDFARLGVADAGTSIQAAEAVAGVRGGQGSAFVTLAETFGVGRILTNQAALRVLLGRNIRQPADTVALKLAGAAALGIGLDMEKQEALGREVIALGEGVIDFTADIRDFFQRFSGEQ